MKRLIEQESCEHGNFEAHQTYIKDRRGNIGAEGPVCPGGTSKEVEVDYEAAAKFGAESKLLGWDFIKGCIDAALGGGR